MSAALVIDDYHFGHHSIVRQIGKALGHLGIMKRQVRKPRLAIPPRQLANLSRANAALAVVNYDVASRALGGRR